MFASWFDVDAACAVAGAGRERAEVADGLARLAEHSLLVVERGEPTRYRALETIRQYGVEQLDAAGELDQIRAGHERWCRLAVAALGRTGRADIDEAWCAPVRPGRRRRRRRARLVRRRRDADGRRRRSWPRELAGLLFLRGRPAQAQRRYEQAAELATRGDRAGGATCGWPPARPPAASSATRRCGCSGWRPTPPCPLGDRAGAARDLATMAMYINRAPGIMATPHSRAEADALVAEARALSDGSPLVQAALAVAEFGDPPAVGDARRIVELAERAGDGILHSIALDQLTLACLVDDDIAEAVRVARRRLDLLDTLAVGPLGGAAALALAQRPRSLGRCRHVLSLRSEHGARKRFVRPEQPNGAPRTDWHRLHFHRRPPVQSNGPRQPIASSYDRRISTWHGVRA